jgi:hypothetical protein
MELPFTRNGTNIRQIPFDGVFLHVWEIVAYVLSVVCRVEIDHGAQVTKGGEEDPFKETINKKLV